MIPFSASHCRPAIKFAESPQAELNDLIKQVRLQNQAKAHNTQEEEFEGFGD